MNDPFGTHPDRNFPEDYEQDNGKYVNKCIYCELFFMGNKHRVCCKKCEAGSIEFWTKLSKKQKPEDNKHAHAGCWADGEMTGYARAMVEKYFPLKEEYEKLKESIQNPF